MKRHSPRLQARTTRLQRSNSPISAKRQTISPSSAEQGTSSPSLAKRRTSSPSLAKRQMRSPSTSSSYSDNISESSAGITPKAKGPRVSWSFEQKEDRREVSYLLHVWLVDHCIVLTYLHVIFDRMT